MDFWLSVNCFLMNRIIKFFDIRNFFCSRSQVLGHVGIFKNYAKFTGKQRCWNLFLIKLQDSYFWPVTFIKNETPAQVFLFFFCEFCEIFKKTFFVEHLRVTAFYCTLFTKLRYSSNIFSKLNKSGIFGKLLPSGVSLYIFPLKTKEIIL